MTSSIRSRGRGWGWAAVVVGLALGLAPLTAEAGERQEEARARFAEGSAAYERGDFRGALKAFDAAYTLAPLPGFLFNVAQCHRQLGEYEQAGRYYQRYLELSEKEPANAGLVRELIAEMEAKGKAEARAREKDRPVKRPERKALDLRPSQELPPAAVPEARIAEEKPPGKRKWLLWAGAGAAVAVIAGGVVYALTAPEPRPTTLGTVRGR